MLEQIIAELQCTPRHADRLTRHGIARRALNFILLGRNVISRCSKNSHIAGLLHISNKGLRSSIVCSRMVQSRPY